MGRSELLVLALFVGAISILVSSGPLGSAAGPYRVCLDPGHEPSEDVGAVTTARFPNGTFELREVDLNLDVAHELRRRLLALGIEVVLTWDGASLGWPEVGAVDLPPPPTIADDQELADPLGLEARGALCVEAGAMAMFSVHHNSLPGAGNGLTTLFRDPGFGQKDGDRVVAEVVHATMWNVLQPGKRSRGFVDFGLFRGDWGVARGAVGIPTVILEPVVISDPAEALRLAPSIAQAGARRLQIVEAEVDAIVAAEAAVRGRVEGGSR
jgi:N-acetylmuramoyl-L-alanine amidase